MKINKVMLLSASALLILASCDQPSESDSTPASLPDDSSVPSTPESPDSLPTSSSEETVSEWGEEYDAIMKEYLYGEILPYFDFEGLEVYYDNELEEVVIRGDTLMKDGDLENYSYSYYEWDGGDISEMNYLPAGTAYRFQKWVETEEGARCVSVTFYGETIDEEGNTSYSSTGSFHLEAYDPYYYEWDDAYPLAFAQYLTGEEEPILPPAFPADYYEVSGQNMAIYCYLNDDVLSDDAGYSDILEGTGWKILEEKDDYGYYVAIAPSENYQVSYLYDEDYGSLDIYFEEYDKPIILDHWDDETISSFFEGYGLTPFEFPALNIEGASYHYYEREDNVWDWIFDDYEQMAAYIEIYPASEDDFTNYLSILGDDGWKVKAEDGGFSASAGKQIGQSGCVLNVDFSGETITIEYFLSPTVIPYSEWPSEAIQEALEAMFEGNVDEIPAYTGNNLGFLVKGNIIQILVEDGEELSGIEAYEGILDAAGWKLSEEEGSEGQWISPNETIFLVPSVGDAGIIELYIGDIPEPLVQYDSFPSDLAKAALNNPSDDLPALEGATYYTITNSVIGDDDYFGSINCVFEGESVDTEALLSGYATTLSEAGFAPWVDNDGETHENQFASPSSQFVVSMESEAYETYSVITVYFDNLVDNVM